jgi:hypothetical protein
VVKDNSPGQLVASKRSEEGSASVSGARGYSKKKPTHFPAPPGERDEYIGVFYSVSLSTRFAGHKNSQT